MSAHLNRGAIGRQRHDCWGMMIAMVMLVALSGCAAGVTQAPVSSPTSQLRIYSQLTSGRDIPDFVCAGLTHADLERWLVPTPHGYFQNPPPGADDTCYMLGDGSWLKIRAIREKTDSQSHDTESYFDAVFTYRFPASFGWGGAGWFDNQRGRPTVPTRDAHASATLCRDSANASYCTYVYLQFDYHDFLLPNVNGVFDPIGTALAMAEAAWSGYSASNPDWSSVELPDVNPDPYVPLTQPIVFTAPSSTTPTTGPSSTPTK